jgi:hypothetical protein
MAITKSLVFQNVVITNADGTSQTTYELPQTETLAITIAAITDMVGAGRTLPSAFDVSCEGVRLLNTNIYNDTRVYGSNTAAEPTTARIIFRGVAGALNLNCGATILNGRRDYGDANRAGVVISFTERVTNVEAFVIES